MLHGNCTQERNAECLPRETRESICPLLLQPAPLKPSTHHKGALLHISLYPRPLHFRTKSPCTRHRLSVIYPLTPSAKTRICTSCSRIIEIPSYLSIIFISSVFVPSLFIFWFICISISFPTVLSYSVFP